MIIFLDFDGVVHPLGLPALNEDGTITIAEPMFCWLPILGDLLVPFPEVRIVVSSDWRFFLSDEQLQRLLGPLGERFAGITDAPNWIDRAGQIAKYVADHRLTQWIALDDHPSVRERQETGDRQFVWCEPETGISTPEIQAQIQALLMEERS